jgi:26S proteasome regulatory subunit N3
VIKTGLRRVNQAYSRITLADIKEKLNLPESTNEEFIVAKAIRDGTLNAVIDHENQFIVTKVRPAFLTP